jgi:hypothetical protein
MKSVIARTLVSLLLGVGTLGSTVHAQSIERSIKATIPFEFSVGDKTFPAGNYRLVSTAPAFLQLRDAAGHSLATVLTNSVQSLNATATPKLQFLSEGGHFRLAQVWQGSYHSGQQLQSRKPQTKIAKRQSGQTQTVAASESQ